MQQHEQALDIKRYLTTIIRRKYVALLVGLAVLSLFTWGSFVMSQIYEASTTVSIERGSALNPLIQGIGVSSPVEDRLRNLKSEITSRSITEKIIKKLGINAGVNNPAQNIALIENIKQNLDVSVIGSPNLFKITYQGNDPEMVAKIVNTITREYIEESKFSRKSDISEAYEFIQSQLLEYKSKLEVSDAAIREFKERNPNLLPQSEATLLSRLEGFQSQKIEAEIRIKELIRKKDNLQKQLSGENELTVAIVTREGSPQARLNYLNNQLMLLMTKYTDNYPEVIKVKSEIEELKGQIAQPKESQIRGSGYETATLNPIYQQLREELAKTDAEIESLRGRVSELLRQRQEVQIFFGRLPKEQEEWEKLIRDRNVYQQLYNQLLQKLENARVSKDIELTEKGEIFRIVDPAQVPLFPVQPNRLKMILLGIFFGIASGIGVVFALEYFDHSFKDEVSIEESLKLPVLATIPKIITEAEEISAKRLERRVFIVSGVYLSLIGLVLIGEFLSRHMGIKIISF